MKVTYARDRKFGHTGCLSKTVNIWVFPASLFSDPYAFCRIGFAGITFRVRSAHSGLGARLTSPHMGDMALGVRGCGRTCVMTELRQGRSPAHRRPRRSGVPGSGAWLAMCRRPFLGWAPLRCGPFRSSRGHFQGPGPRVSWAALPHWLKDDVPSMGQRRRPGSCAFPTQAWPTGDRD